MRYDAEDLFCIVYLDECYLTKSRSFQIVQEENENKSSTPPIVQPPHLPSTRITRSTSRRTNEELRPATRSSGKIMHGKPVSMPQRLPQRQLQGAFNQGN